MMSEGTLSSAYIEIGVRIYLSSVLDISTASKQKASWAKAQGNAHAKLPGVLQNTTGLTVALTCMVLNHILPH